MTSSNSHVSAFDRAVIRYTGAILRNRWWVVFVTIGAGILLAAGATKLTIRGDYRYNFGENNPQLAAFEALQATYTKSDSVLFAVLPKDGDVFRPSVIRAVAELTEAGWQIPYSIRVDSITNYQHTYAEADDLVVGDLVEDPTQLDAATLEHVRQVSLAEPLLRGRLISDDGRSTAVNVTIQLPDDTQSHERGVLNVAKQMVADLEERYPDIDFALTGIITLSAAINEIAEDDLRTLLPLMYGVIVLSMALFLRSLWGTVITTLVVGLSASTAMGAAGWLGIPLTPQAVTAPTIVLTVAIADGVHVLVSLAKGRHAGLSKEAALIESMRLNMGPIFLTSLTTGIGFLSLNFSDAPPFADLGNITTMGVFAAWVYSVTLLPALVMIVPYRASQRSGALSLARFADWLVRFRHRVLAGCIATTVVLGAMIPRIELNDMFLEFFDRGIAFRDDTDLIRERLTGMYQINFSLASGEAQGISEPAYLSDVDRFAQWLRAQPEVMHVAVFSDIQKRLNRNMHGDEPSWHRLPDQRELAAQYLLLYEMSLPYGLDLNNQVNIDKSATKVTATLTNLTARELREIDDRSQAWLAENAPAPMGGNSSGTSLMFAHLSKRNIEGMLRGTTVAFALISITLMVFLRSLSLGLLSLIPNIVPTAIAFGIWALLVGQVGFAVAMVTACSLGIIVDATVHFLSKYLRARRENNASAEDGVRYALETVGSALIVTFLILLIGFSVLAFSPFRPNAVLGQLITITIGAALLADFFLLPTLLMLVDRRSRGRPA